MGWLRSRSLVTVAVVALLLLTVGTASAARLPKDPPVFGIVSLVVGAHTAHLEVALPAVQRALPPGPCNVMLSFNDANGRTVAGPQAVMLNRGQAFALQFGGKPTKEPGGDKEAEKKEAEKLPIKGLTHVRGIIEVVADADRKEARRNAEACRGLVGTVQVSDNATGIPTVALSPSDLEDSFRRASLHLFGPLAIGFGHTARLTAVNIQDAPKGKRTGVCRIQWAFVDETGVQVAFGEAMIAPGQAIFADFDHTDAGRGVAHIRAEVIASGDAVNADCPSDGVIGLLEGLETDTGVGHAIVPAQIILPAVQ